VGHTHLIFFRIFVSTQPHTHPLHTHTHPTQRHTHRPSGHSHTPVFTDLQTRTDVGTHTHTRVHTQTHIRTETHAHQHTFTHTQTHTHTERDSQSHTHTHTHTHTHCSDTHHTPEIFIKPLFHDGSERRILSSDPHPPHTHTHTHTHSTPSPTHTRTHLQYVLTTNIMRHSNSRNTFFPHRGNQKYC